jgi:hypothetical protein
MTFEDLTPYKAQFKAVVLKHIHESLGADEWERLRSFAAEPRRYFSRKLVANLEASPEMLFDEAVSEDNMSVNETLIPAFKATEIGRIEDQPVYYVENQGIYVWGKQPDSRLTLMFWVTDPAYPPDW